MKKIFLITLLITFLLGCKEEDTVTQAPSELSFKTQLISIKEHTAFVSDTPQVKGKTPLKFLIKEITNDGNILSAFDGLSIDNEIGIISLQEENRLPLGINSITILVSNDEGETLFDDVFQIDINEIQPPSDLSYADNELMLNYDQDYVTEVPELKGDPSFVFSFPIDFVNEELAINSETGVITINTKQLSPGQYSIPVLVSNNDGETLFQNAFQFEILSRYNGYPEGYYFMNSTSGELSDLMISNQVEDGSFSTMERQGLHFTYSYLETGNYHLASIVRGDLATYYGGEVEAVLGSNDSFSCGLNAYSLVNQPIVEGSSLTVDVSGLHLILFDSLRSEIIFQPIRKVAIIGSATEKGWGADTELLAINTGKDGAEFRLEETALRAGELRFRFNCQWVINRLIDETQPLDNPNNGYIIQTSLSSGVNTGELLIGGEGSDISIDNEQEGFYDVSLKWEGGSQFTYQLTRVGDLPTTEFDPSAFDWAIVGEATEVGWPTDNDCNTDGQDIGLTYVGESAGSYHWQIEGVNLTTGAFKFRANNCWEVNLGTSNASITGAASDNFNFQADNFNCLVSGAYNINLFTEDEGVSYVMEVSQ